MDPNEIYYQSNCFYINLDDTFDLIELDKVSESSLSLEQSAFLHEYYHYLINITTYEGIRDFVFSFIDRVISVTNLLVLKGLSAFPINTNKDRSCRFYCKYLSDIKRIKAIDLVNKSLSDQVSNSPRRKFEIDHLSKSKQFITFKNESMTKRGYRPKYLVHTKDLVFTQKFTLSIGAIDEFLSSSIDEFCFQNDIAPNLSLISSRRFYPYQFFDEIIKYYYLEEVIGTSHKILISYSALNSINPVCTFINILSRIQKAPEKFEVFPEGFVLKCLKKKKYFLALQEVIDSINQRVEESKKQGREFYSAALYYIYYTALLAKRNIETDFFYYIRPFLTKEIESDSGKREFISKYKQIRTSIPSPLIAVNKQIKDPFNQITQDTFQYGEGLSLIATMTSIMDSLYSNKYARNVDGIMFLNHKLGNDDIENLVPYSKDSWQIALNQFGLLGVYLTER